MMARLAAGLCALAVAAMAGPKKPVEPVSTRGENQDVTLQVTLYYTPEQVKELLGSDLDGHYMVAEVKVEPKFTKEIVVDRDDFTLRTDKDGEKAKPFAPTQIAGRGALVIRQTSVGGGGMGENSGPRIGIPGRVGGPTQLPGDGGYVGNGGNGDMETPSAKADNGQHEAENPLLKTLRTRALVEKKITEPVTGLLYFAMEKQKLKDLELWYGARDTLIRMRFKTNPR